MRIAFIAGEYPPMQGGLGDFTRELAQAIAAAGHESHILTLPAPPAPADETVNGVHIHRTMPAWGWQTRRHVEAFIRQWRPDVINLQYQAAAYQMHGAINLLPAQLAKHTRTVVTFHDLRVPYLFPKAGPLRWQAVLHMARSAHHVIVTNAEDEATLHKAGLRHVSVVPIGSNIAPATLPHFEPNAWRTAQHIDPQQTLIGYFGFMNESKGGETLIRALAELSDLNVGLILIGGQHGASDPTNIAYATFLAELAHTLKIDDRIYRTGFIDDAGVSTALRACACLALPYRDGVSFRRGTLMAALAHGCAIVSTQPRVALPEVIDQQNMLLVPPDNPVALAAAIRRVLSDLALRHTLQSGSLALSQHFQWDNIAQKTLPCFRV
ncbi:MAG: glycosyltransferase family 4 protein [Anaerolineae bacterium]|nr:glycosyltransferase family 4 protein [Anaerolineae bacterium]